VALLARRDERGLHFVGNPFSTLKAAERDLFWQFVEQFAAEAPPMPLNAKGRFLQPGMRAKVRHLRGDGMLRAASLKALSFD
jgi:bifunctional non-homologous end joining protein LigD